MPPDNPEDQELLLGGLSSSLTQHKRAPAAAHEDVMGEYHTIDENDLPQYDGGFYVQGRATLKSPFTGTAKTWFASRLAHDFSYASPIDTGDFPEQGEPEYGTLNRIKQTLLFNASFTKRVKHLDFDAAVAAIRQHLLDHGAIEGEPPCSCAPPPTALPASAPPPTKGSPATRSPTPRFFCKSPPPASPSRATSPG